MFALASRACRARCVCFLRVPTSGLALLQVFEKSRLLLNQPQFSVYLNNTPPWTAARLYQYVSQLTCRPLSGVAVYNPKRESPGVWFARFDTFEQAQLLLDLSDAGKLRADGFVMRAGPGKNTAFVQLVAQAMDSQQSAEWTFDKLHAFTQKLPTCKWPPIKGNIEQVLHTVPCEFALDDSEQKVYRVRVQVQADAPPPRAALLTNPDAAKARAAKGAAKPNAAKTRAAKGVAKADAPPPSAASLCKPDAAKARAAKGAAKADATKTRTTKGAAKTDAPPPPAAFLSTVHAANTRAAASPSEPNGRAVCAHVYERSRNTEPSCLYVYQAPGFTPLPRLWHNEPVPTTPDDGLSDFDIENFYLLPVPGPEESSRFAFANVCLSMKGSDDGCCGRWPVASESGRTDGQPVSPCFSTNTDIKPEDSRSMCSQAPTHFNPMRSWGVQQVAEFFERLGFPADAVRHGSVDGETLLQKFEEGDSDFFTQPTLEGLGLTKLQYNGRLRTELLRCTKAEP